MNSSGLFEVLHLWLQHRGTHGHLLPLNLRLHVKTQVPVFGLHNSPGCRVEDHMYSSGCRVVLQLLFQQS